MPNLLTKRRSLLDLLSVSSDNNDGRPKTSSLAIERPHLSDERPKSEYGFPRSRLSRELLRDELPEPEDHQDSRSTRSKRFSMLKMRNYSESHLSVRAKQVEKLEREDAPPVPAVHVPAIVKTAPTMDFPTGERHETQVEYDEHSRDRKTRPSLFKRSLSKGRSPARREPRKSTDEKRSEDKSREKKPSSLRWRKLQGRSTGLEDLARMAASQVASNQTAPPSYDDESNSALALPVPGHRFSESSRSDGSNGSADQIYGSTTTTTHTVSTHTTFFKLARRNKNRNSLFPLPVKIPPPSEPVQQDDPPTPRASTSAFSSKSDQHGANGNSAQVFPRRHTEEGPIKPSPLAANTALARGALSFAEPGGMSLMRNESQRSRASSSSSPIQPPRRLGMRDRASTTSSFGRTSYDAGTPPPVPGSLSGRTSTSTTGRTSLGNLLNLSRFRQGSDPHSPRHGSPGTRSKSNSFAISRETLVVPEREEGDTPSRYLERLEAAVARSMIAGILSKSADPFAQAVLRSYTRRFSFFGEPLDMSLRKFLLEAELPKETQQVDRVLQAFADRYHECNPGIFVSSDFAYIVAFSLMMLHTDVYNKNNKRKMQKQDYLKNTAGQRVSDEVLGCFYDNICYTPFIHYEEEVDINGEHFLPFKPRKSKSKVKLPITDVNKKPSGPADPYDLLRDNTLDKLRPAIGESISMEDPFNYKATQRDLDPHYLQRAFTHTGTLQIISQRSRPTAYEGQFTNHAPPALMEMQPGIINIKVTKVGTLWRKDAKKKKARSPWNEWGAVLTGSQLYMFKNVHWVKGLTHQFNSAQVRGRPRTPVTFTPPLQDFKYDAILRTDNAVALVDSSYNRHKNAFTFIGPSGQEEVLLADNESELNDWLALINYAAAFRAAGVRIRGMVGGAEEDTRSKDVRRLESTQSARSAQSAASDVAQNRLLSPQMQRQVMAARRQIMVQKVAEATNEISEANKDLEDMLRNARHLQILAPVVPKTREDIIHAAAQLDASLKWRRRDIWRMKCYKDIIAMDVQQDGVSAEQIEALAEQQQQAEVPESAKKTLPMALSRLTSKASAFRTSPQSPGSPTFAKRPSTTGSLEAFTNDIFRTPSESTTQQHEGEWRLPPLQLDVQASDPHRASISSALLSSSYQSRNSVSQASTTSGGMPVDGATSDEPVDGTTPRPQAPSSALLDPEVELLARASMTPDPIAARGVKVDGAASPVITGTPESSNKQRTGVRRSLQKTLRDPHHHGSSVHKHRKGKGSDSTVRSTTGAPVVKAPATATKDMDKDTAEAVEDGTPGLKREKGRFVLHGKQASVVQFGTEWPDARMKARREAWRQASGSTTTTLGTDQQRTPLASPVHRGNSYGLGGADGLGLSPRDFGQQENGANRDVGGHEVPHDSEFQYDAEAAEAYAEHRASPLAMSDASRSGSDARALDDDEEDDRFYDASPTQSQKREKRGTVIGPSQQLQKLETLGPRRMSPDEVDSDDDSDNVSPTRKSAKRTTVIGPNTKQPFLSPLLPLPTQQAQTTREHDGSAQAGAEEDEDDSDEYTTPPSDAGDYEHERPLSQGSAQRVTVI
ncbi:hypothetical protein LTR09_000484 [Extremus antarcticus]|uniref:Uncharacterized protein n=1 Tax=Extremus antarcticus TaxID=702011 RepID=A0AAJ0LXJ9_9PEZI|nr:hypothetical protein LTR09_000484 [Extremus antarcticus]